MEALLLRNAHRPPAAQAGIGSFATSMHLSKDAIAGALLSFDDQYLTLTPKQIAFSER